MVTPFSLGMLLELLLGELGPEPGALLHADSRTHTAQMLGFSDMLNQDNFWEEICLYYSDSYLFINAQNLMKMIWPGLYLATRKLHKSTRN